MVAPTAPTERGRAIVVLVFAVVIAVALLCGLGYLIFGSTQGKKAANPASSASASPSTVDTTDGSQQNREDALAAAPMLQLPDSAAQPQALVTATAGPAIVLPAATARIVPGGPPVATGFPHTPEGAIAQLAAIDEAAMSAADQTQVHLVYAWAAMSGAVAESDWLPGAAVASVLGEANVQASQIHLSFQTVEAQIKGTVGSDFVLACVLGELDVTISTIGRGGLGDCQRMVWSQNRWWIGPGAQPAKAPSAWPGSADSVRGGWRVLKHGS
jgi:hypothetical protein